MARPLTIVMYHYVRNPEETRFPHLNVLSVDEFHAQLAYLKRHYTFVTVDDVLAAMRDPKTGLPENAVLLTFDDGYVDHYTVVFPTLQNAGIQGAFFVPAAPVVDGRILQVNKIQMLLSTVADKALLGALIDEAVQDVQAEPGLLEPAAYRAENFKPSRFDPADVVYVKRMLQGILPVAMREALVDRLFAKFVSDDEASVISEMYASEEQLKEMIEGGMYIGSHGANHMWMNTISEADQKCEIDASLNFLKRIGAPVDNWMMCYPYGRYNDTLVEVCRARKACLGVTTVVDIADLDRDDLMLLPRLDTNDLPKQADAPANEWTRKILV